MVSSSPARRNVRSMPSESAATSARTVSPIERTRPSAISAGSVNAKATSASDCAATRISRARRTMTANPQTNRMGSSVRTPVAIRSGSERMSPGLPIRWTAAGKLRSMIAAPSAPHSSVNNPASQNGARLAAGIGRTLMFAGARAVSPARAPTRGRGRFAGSTMRERMGASLPAARPAAAPLGEPVSASRTNSVVAAESCASRSSRGGATSGAGPPSARKSVRSASSTACSVSSEMRLADGVRAMGQTFGDAELDTHRREAGARGCTATSPARGDALPRPDPRMRLRDRKELNRSRPPGS